MRTSPNIKENGCERECSSSPGYQHSVSPLSNLTDLRLLFNGAELGLLSIMHTCGTSCSMSPLYEERLGVPETKD